jgi:hypothetical protein
MKDCDRFVSRKHTLQIFLVANVSLFEYCSGRNRFSVSWLSTKTLGKIVENDNLIL